MSPALQDFFSREYMPHGHCYYWQPGILWTHVISDILIALAYFSIPLVLFYLFRNRRHTRLGHFPLLFTAFIFCCGITHLLGIYTIWHGAYGLHGISKAVTALVSVFTALSLIRNCSVLLKIPTHEEMKEALHKASEEELKRCQLEYRQKAEEIFRFTLELMPTGLLVIDPRGTIRIANEALEQLFGYGKNELTGKNLSCLLLDDHHTHHGLLVERYLENPSNGYAMAAGRTVTGKAKDGSTLALEVNLSVHEIDGEKHGFATVYDISETGVQKDAFLEKSGRLHRAVDATNDGIWEWNVETGKLWLSARFKKIAGIAHKKQTSFEDWMRRIHPLDRPAFDQALDEHFRKGEKFDLTYRGLDENGIFVWLRARGDSLFDRDGKPLLMSGTLTDINDIKTLEERLQEKTRTLNLVLQKSLCAIYIYDIEQHRISFVNPEFEKLTGYAFEELNAIQTQDIRQLFHENDREQVKSHFNAVVNSQPDESNGCQYRLRHKEGRWIWCFARDTLLSIDCNGNPQTFLGTFFDISQLKKNELEVHRLAQDFYSTFEQAAVGIAHVSPEGQFLKANSKLCEILGYPRETLLELTFQNITHPEDLSEDLNLLHDLTEGRIQFYSMEKRYIRADNNMIWANLTVAAVRSNDGEIRHFISVIQDISERKKIELSLAESNAALERFAYSASHDLQEPLRKIGAFSGSLKKRLSGKLNDNEAEFELDRICDASKRMSEMINSLLQLSRLSSKALECRQTTLAELLNCVTNDLLPLIEEYEAQVHCDSDCLLFVDPPVFEQVLRNIISNSIHYSYPSIAPVIHISCEQQNGLQIIRCSDNGPGFDSEQREKIFEPFQRLVGREHPGSGMGLAICRQIVNAHCGRIHADSSPGKGCTTVIELPIREN